MVGEMEATLREKGVDFLVGRARYADKIIVGEWKGLKFGADGSLKTSGVAKGRWQWVNRSKRALLIDFQPSSAKDITYTLTPDGMGLIGKDTTGAAKSSDRVK